MCSAIVTDVLASGKVRESGDRTVPEFFRHHGFMSPGVRLFRSIGFSAKSLWVSMAFLIPMFLLSASLWWVTTTNINFSARERLGVEYIRAAVPLLDVAQQRRRAATVGAADLEDLQRQTQSAMDALAAVQTRLGARIDVKKSFEAVRSSQERLASQAGAASPAEIFAAHTALIAQIMELINDAADESNLTLDPEITTFYLMDAAINRQLRLVESLGQLRGMGNSVLRSGTMTQTQRDTLAYARALASYQQDAANKDISRAVAADPGLARELGSQEVLAANETMLTVVATDFFGEKPTGNADEFVALANKTIKINYEMVGHTLDGLDERLQQRVSSLHSGMWLKLLIAALGVALACYLLVAFYRVTQGGIGEVSRQLQEISSGNLTLRPRPWGRDEVAELMNTLASTLESLRRVVRQVRTGVAEIETASGEVASASMDLSNRTESTATQLEDAATAMGNIRQAVKQTAGVATEANSLMEQNALVAGRGGQVVSEVAQTMHGIRDSSGRIADITGTIDSIAFQTNILAINAAVEAARAGEAGRGFAVVAAEVRALAQRSGDAARQIKELISGSVAQVEAGTNVAGRAGDTMGEIVGNAQRLQKIITEISDAADQQAGGLEEVGSTVEQLDATTQQNAALVEELAAAAGALKDNALRLKQEFAYFRLPA